MATTIRKIAHVDVPPKGDNFHGGLYRVWFKGHKVPVFMYKATFEVARLEDEMLLHGIPAGVIGKYKRAVLDCYADQQSSDGEGQ